jgi:hypothetical protein
MSLIEAPFFPRLGLWLGATWFVATHLILAIGLGIGWVHGFPRWVYPYIGLLTAHLAYSFYYIGSPRWLLLGSLLWLPLLAVLIPVLLLNRSPQPLGDLCSGIWRDWTRLSFAVYGFVPGLIFISFDEVHWPQEILNFSPAMLAMAAGALIYIRSTTVRQRALALLLALSLAWTIATAGLAFY